MCYLFIDFSLLQELKDHLNNQNATQKVRTSQPIVGGHG